MADTEILISMVTNDKQTDPITTINEILEILKLKVKRRELEEYALAIGNFQPANPDYSTYLLSQKEIWKREEETRQTE